MKTNFLLVKVKENSLVKMRGGMRPPVYRFPQMQ